MGSPVIYPETWIPYMTNKDCSQGLCSLYCPQWCDFVFPSPPPPPFQFPNQDSSTNFSPLVIAVIGILASALLLVSYYTLISKFCGRMGSRRSEIHGLDAEPEDEHRPSVREPWRVTVTGLDEALIKSIAVCRYKKGSINGELTGGVCSVCLGEFQEDESLRLLPKCSHAFHVPCIDTWLASHSNCPLCRSDIVFVANSDSSSAPLQPALATHNANLPRNDQSLPGTHQEIENHRSLDAQDSAVEEAMHVSNTPKTPSQEVGNLQDMQCAHTMIEVRDTESSQLHPFFRRSFSMGHSCRTHISVADVLQAEDEEERLGIRVEECPANANLGTCKHSLGGGCR